ncbi:MAG: type II secretion system F family protein [Candidatus Omnitrophica bacterium]|nr:type II secretion system F family protein [Candidatus Omnitrophota bacterium]
MTIFAYKAKSGPHKIVDGSIEAPTQGAAVRQVVALGLTPLEVVPAPSQPSQGHPSVIPHVGKLKFSLPSARKVSAKEVVFFTRQMSDLVEAAVPILRSLQIVANQTRHPYFKDTVEQMHALVQNGGSLSSALGQYPSVFPPFYVNMVKTGEVGGHLDKVLRRLSEHLEKELETRGKINSSLAYPLFVLGVGALTIFVLLTFVIPRLSVMFEDLDQALPLPTVILVNVSGFFARYWWLLLGIFVIIKIYGGQWLRSPQGRLWLDSFKLKMPFLGEFIKTVEIARFARTLGTLLESGVPLTTALGTIYPTIDNVVMREEIKKVSRGVADGMALKSVLGQCVFFPEMAVSMVSVGEESGRLEKGLYKIAETLERQAEETVKVMTSLLGPAVLVVIVSIVGFAVIAMLLPIFRMNMLIQ